MCVSHCCRAFLAASLACLARRCLSKRRATSRDCVEKAFRSGCWMTQGPLSQNCRPKRAVSIGWAGAQEGWGGGGISQIGGERLKENLFGLNLGCLGLQEDSGSQIEIVEEPKAESMKQWCVVKDLEQVQGIAEMSNGYFQVNQVKEREDGVYVEIQPTTRYLMEEMFEEPEEISLRSQMRKKLRKSLESAKAEVLAADVSEVYSPPRVVPVAEKSGLKGGKSYDVLTGFDLRSEVDRRRMWKSLKADDPLLIILCPPCTPFCKMQHLNFGKMELSKALVLVGEGVEHLEICSGVMRWQHRRGRLFAFEQPDGSMAWKEECIRSIAETAEGVTTVKSDMCAFGMNVNGNGLNLKTTKWMTNCDEIAEEVGIKCNGDHPHVPLVGGLPKKAAVYPEALCQALVQGLKKYIGRKKGVLRFNNQYYQLRARLWTPRRATRMRMKTMW